MFDVPVDGWYAWLGVAAAGATLFGVAAGLPTAPPPDAAGAADTVDRTTTAEFGATAERPLDADTVELTPRGLGLRNDAGTTHARFVYGPVTPVAEGTALWRVLAGVPPDRAFESDRTFRRAVDRARQRDVGWRAVDGPLLVRHLALEGRDVTLVGA